MSDFSVIRFIKSNKSDYVDFEFDAKADVSDQDAKLHQLIVQYGLPLLSGENAINALKEDLSNSGLHSAALLVAEKNTTENKVIAVVSHAFNHSTSGSQLKSNFAELLSSPSGEEEALALARKDPTYIREFIKQNPKALESASEKTTLLIELLTLLSEEERKSLLEAAPSLIPAFETALSNLKIIENVNRNQMPLDEVLWESAISNKSPDFFLKIAHLFTYVDLKDIHLFNPSFGSTDFLEKFIENCSNLTHLRINSGNITKLPALPFCTHLDCSGCTELTSLPALPNCINLNYSGCTGLIKKFGFLNQNQLEMITKMVAPSQSDFPETNKILGIFSNAVQTISSNAMNIIESENSIQKFGLEATAKTMKSSVSQTIESKNNEITHLFSSTTNVLGSGTLQLMIENMRQKHPDFHCYTCDSIDEFTECMVHVHGGA